MVGVIYGTTGELIKLAPVIVELESRGSRPQLWCTGQQARQIPSFQHDLGLREVDLWLAQGSRGDDLSRKREIPRWSAEASWNLMRQRGSLRRRLASSGKPFVLVHGDTMTTVFGALAGRALRVPVGHVEAGLRSGNWRDPFPEELDRRAAARLVDVNYAPGTAAVANLTRERVRGEIIDTGQNTVRDALGLALDARVPTVELPAEPFGLVSIHRFELIERPQLLRPLLEVLRDHSRRQPLMFIDHSTTQAVIDRSAALQALFDERFRRVPRQPYLEFIALMRRADFIISDSGGSQEESAILGIPCLIHRTVSERQAGVGETVVLSGLDLDVVRSFLEHPNRWRTDVVESNLGPSKIIVDDLARRGVV
jgi:UDP-N-acetylglucosamine 2-epimerase (non-hydrolysing)